MSILPLTTDTLLRNHRAFFILFACYAGLISLTRCSKASIFFNWGLQYIVSNLLYFAGLTLLAITERAPHLLRYLLFVQPFVISFVIFIRSCKRKGTRFTVCLRTNNH